MNIKIEREIHTIDATNQILGRLACRIANLLNGKHKPIFSPHRDLGDIVFVKNAAKIKVSGKKSEAKVYHHHSNYPGGLKTRPFGKVFAKNPAEVLYLAVIKMLPKNKLRTKKLKRLKITA